MTSSPVRIHLDGDGLEQGAVAGKQAHVRVDGLPLHGRGVVARVQAELADAVAGVVMEEIGGRLDPRVVGVARVLRVDFRNLDAIVEEVADLLLGALALRVDKLQRVEGLLLELLHQGDVHRVAVVDEATRDGPLAAVAATDAHKLQHAPAIALDDGAGRGTLPARDNGVGGVVHTPLAQQTAPAQTGAAKRIDWPARLVDLVRAEEADAVDASVDAVEVAAQLPRVRGVGPDALGLDDAWRREVRDALVVVRQEDRPADGLARHGQALDDLFGVRVLERREPVVRLVDQGVRRGGLDQAHLADAPAQGLDRDAQLGRLGLEVGPQRRVVLLQLAQQRDAGVRLLQRQHHARVRCLLRLVPLICPVLVGVELLEGG
eukprot:m.111811 g.111811  ORF g.111811 m.111811 type:complete len:376 (+) comp9097_c0_seq1:83-1210(+)